MVSIVCLAILGFTFQIMLLDFLIKRFKKLINKTKNKKVVKVTYEFNDDYLC